MRKTWLSSCSSRREICWISNPLLIVPIQSFSILHNLSRPWLSGWLVTLLPFFKIEESVRRFYMIFTLDYLYFKKVEIGGITKSRTIIAILISVWDSFKILKFEKRQLFVLKFVEINFIFFTTGVVQIIDLVVNHNMRTNSSELVCTKFS